MARRGRKSESSLTVVPLIPGTGRPSPPRGLDQAERRIWKAIVDALPAYWIDPAGQLVLRRVICLTASLACWEVQLRELRARGAADSEEATKLVAAHGNTAKVVTYLLGQLRATPKARVISRNAGVKIEEVPRARPWEIKARSEAD
jgi:hypothetical protein